MQSVPITTEDVSSNPAYAYGEVYLLQHYMTYDRSVVFGWYSSFLKQQKTEILLKVVLNTITLNPLTKIAYYLQYNCYLAS